MESKFRAGSRPGESVTKPRVKEGSTLIACKMTERQVARLGKD